MSGPPDATSVRRRSICLYTPSADPSGMGMHMLDLAAEYRSDAEVSLMAWPTSGGRRLLDAAAELGVRAVPLPHPRAETFGPAIREFLQTHPTDVFHLHVGTGREDFEGARAARDAGVGLVVQTQHLSWLMGSRKHRVPLLHALEPVGHVITVSEGLRHTYEVAGVPPQSISTVLNGIRPRGPGYGRATAREALGLDPDQPVVMTVGRLTVVKGQRHLVAAALFAAHEVPDLAVVLIGEGHLRQQLQAQAAALGLSGVVRFAGHRSDARMLLDAADLFVLPSLHEGMPLALLEAMDAGLAVVATRVIGSDEVVSHDETGLLVPARRPAELAEAICRLLSDDVLRERFAGASRQRYLDRFTSRHMAAQTRSLYERLLYAGAVEDARARERSEAEPMPGGNTAPVVRMGDTVRRVAGPWTPNVAALMTGLRSAGVPGVPAHLGLDEQGREVVEFVSGEVPVYPMPQWLWDDRVLTDVGRAVRAVHDASLRLDLPMDGWRREAVAPVEVVCHGDVAPYNCVFVDRRLVALIDWDYALPGPRLRDLGAAAYRFVSLTPLGHTDGLDLPAAEQWRRVGVLCEAYGDVAAFDVVRWAALHLEDLIAYSYAEAAAGNAALQATIDAGHVRLYEGDLEHVRSLLG